MVVHIVEPKDGRDWSKVAGQIAQGLVEASWLNGPNVYAAIRQSLGIECAREHETDERAWNWCYVTLATTLSKTLHGPKIEPFLDWSTAKAGTKGFIQNTFVLDGNEALDSAALKNPANAPVFAKARNAFPGFIDRVAPGHDMIETQARAFFDSTLREVWSRVAAKDVDYYQRVVDALSSQSAEADRRELAWLRHHDWIRGLYDRTPIFEGEREDGRVLTLAQTYLPLRCYWHKEIEQQKEEREHTRRKVDVHVDWLHATMHRWLEGETRDPVRVVAGGPGSGKSSFARVFASEVIAKTTYRVVFIPLQHMTLGGDLAERIGKFLHMRHSDVTEEGASGFPDNPLDWMAQDETPILFVFDGLDELARSDDKAEDLTRKFISSVTQMIAARRGTAKLRAVVLGRSTACQQAVAEANMDAPCLLHVAPLLRMDVSEDEDEVKSRLSEGSREIITICDPGGILGEEQRDDFWRQWCAAVGMECGAIPEAVTHGDMGELNAEPLLLYLLILSGYTGENWREAQENRSLVYHAIFARIYERNRKKEYFAAEGIDEGDFFSLMECLGLAAWQGNGRTGSDEDFEVLRGHYDKKRKKKFKKLTAAKLENVAIQFYTRQDVGDTKGFEFIHKSFGEYLVARALINGSARIAERLRDDDEPEEMALVWMRLIGDGELTPEILRFMREEARRVRSDGMKDDLRNLTALFDWTLRNGIPVHREMDSADVWRMLETRQRNAEGALLAVSTVRAVAFPKEGESTLRVETEWQDNQAALSLLYRQQSVSNDFILLALHRLNLPEVCLNWANLNGAHLNETNLSGAQLIETNLNGAHLKGADLSRAHLNWANLNGAHLVEANLTRAFPIDAKLRRADLTGANLNRAHLNEADLSGADLSGADLSGADLSGADLTGAQLNAANLNGVNLNSANLNGTNIDSCRLQSAILRNTRNLTQSQIDTAILDEHTQLPEGLVNPHAKPDPGS